MPLKISTLYLILLACFIPTSAYSQPSDTSNNKLTVLPEEIVITGELPPYQVQKLIFDAEESLYDLFNELNDDKRFQITCSTDNRVYSHISERACLPKFHRDATRAEALDYLAIYRTQLGAEGELSGGNAPLGSSVPTGLVAASMQDQLKNKMEELASESPEFLEALIKYVELKEQYTRLKSK